MIAMFSVLEAVSLYAWSWNFLQSLTKLHQTIRLNEMLRQSRGMINALDETLGQQHELTNALEHLRVFLATEEEAQVLLGRAMDLTEDEPDVHQALEEAQKSLESLRAIADQAISSEPGARAKAMIASQHLLEALERIAHAQISINERSDRVYEALESEKFQPAVWGVFTTLIFFLIILILGLRATFSIKNTLQGLRKATEAISRGDFSSRAPIAEEDEIGQVAFAFNRMAENLQESTVTIGYFESVIESMLDCVIVLDPHGVIRRVNQMTLTTFGYGKEELLGEHVQLLFPEGLTLVSSLYNAEKVCVSREGKKIPVAVSLTPLADGKDDDGGYVCVIEDITERKRTETEIQQRNLALASANRELEAFSYSVSHDLRAPLRAVDGFSHALLEDCGDHLDETCKGYLKRVRAATQSMGKLIDDLLNLSRLSRTAMSVAKVDLSAIANDIIKRLQEAEPNRDMEIRVQEKIWAQVDPSLIKIALENLLSNAWKYTSKHAKGHIEFGVVSTPRGQALFVRDDGAGFDMAYAQRLFGAFQRLHSSSEFPGTGIGLATVQRIIHRHGGLIWAESQVEKGAIFYLTLPGLEASGGSEA